RGDRRVRAAVRPATLPHRPGGAAREPVWRNHRERLAHLLRIHAPHGRRDSFAYRHPRLPGRRSDPLAAPRSPGRPPSRTDDDPRGEAVRLQTRSRRRPHARSDPRRRRPDDDGDVLLDAGAPAYLNPRVRNLRAPAISWGAGASSQASSVPAVPRASTFERRGTPVRPYRNHGTRRPTYPALRPRLGIVGATTAERTPM